MNRLLRLDRKVRSTIAGMIPGHFPRLYSTLDAPELEVPVQVAAYKLAAGKYIRPGDRVLDVGFGLGYGMRIMAESAAEVCGVEIDRRAVKRGIEVLGESPRIGEVRHYNGYDIPFADSSFEVVTCIDVLEHVPDYVRFLCDSGIQRGELSGDSGGVLQCNLWNRCQMLPTCSVCIAIFINILILSANPVAGFSKANFILII